MSKSKIVKKTAKELGMSVVDFIISDEDPETYHSHSRERKTLRQAFAVARATGHEVPEWLEGLLLEVLTEGGRVKRREINKIHARIMEMITNL
jgi:hypothetical protein